MKGGAWSDKIDLYNFQLESIDYYSIIEKWNKFIKKANIIIRPYSKQFLPNKYSLYEDFFKYVYDMDFNEIKKKLTIPEKDPNPSLDAVSGLVANYYAQIIKDVSRDTLISQLIAIQNRHGVSKTYLFDAAERKSILSPHRKGNKALVKEYKVPFELFEIENKEYDKPSEAEIAERLSHLYRRADYLLPLSYWNGKGHLRSLADQNKIIFVNGFHQVQKRVVWTKGNEVSKLAFLAWRDFYNSCNHLRVSIKSAYLPKSETVSFMRIGDGEWMRLTGNNHYEISTEEVRRDGGVVFVEFKHTNATSPKKLGISADARVFGCRIEAINFEKNDPDHHRAS